MVTYLPETKFYKIIYLMQFHFFEMLNTKLLSLWPNFEYASGLFEIANQNFLILVSDVNPINEEICGFVKKRIQELINKKSS